MAWNISHPYRGNAAFVNVKGAIQNPRTGNRAPFEFECMVDTGFFSGLYYEESLRSDAKIIGVDPFPTTIRLADGKEVPAYSCVAYLEEINGFKLPPPGLKITLFMKRQSDGIFRERGSTVLCNLI